MYEGRGWDVVGSHTLNYNDVANGFCVMGDFTARIPNELALNATKNIISCGVELVNTALYVLSTILSIGSHLTIGG